MKTAVQTMQKLQETAFVWWLLGVLVAFISLYLYYVNDAVRNVVLRERAEQEINEIRSILGEKDHQYLALEQKMTLEYAESLGFKESKNPVFVSRETAGTALSFNSNEI